MTQLEALDDLIAAVRSGETSRVHIERMSGKAGLAEAGSIYGAAYQDDLNAARMVHKALVPWCQWHLASEASGDGFVTQIFDTNADGYTGHGHNQVFARAWLLAALQAHRSTLVSQ